MSGSRAAYFSAVRTWPAGNGCVVRLPLLSPFMVSGKGVSFRIGVFVSVFCVSVAPSVSFPLT